MAVPIIDHLKVINVNDEQGQSLPLFPVRQHVFNLLTGGCLIVQLGEGIPFSPGLQFLGRCFLIIDIYHDPDRLTRPSLVIELHGCPKLAPLVTAPGIRYLELQFPIAPAGTHLIDKYPKRSHVLGMEMGYLGYPLRCPGGNRVISEL